MSKHQTSRAVGRFKEKFSCVLADVEPILGKVGTEAGRKSANFAALLQLPRSVPLAEESVSESSDTDIGEERPSDAFVGVLSSHSQIKNQFCNDLHLSARITRQSGLQRWR
jgi:hypothetical protein